MRSRNNNANIANLSVLKATKRDSNLAVHSVVSKLSTLFMRSSNSEGVAVLRSSKFKNPKFSIRNSKSEPPNHHHHHQSGVKSDTNHNASTVDLSLNQQNNVPLLFNRNSGKLLSLLRRCTFFCHERWFHCDFKTLKLNPKDFHPVKKRIRKSWKVGGWTIYAKNKDDRLIDTASNTSNFNNLCHSEQVAPKSFMNECAGSTFFAGAYSPEEQLLTVELVSQNK